MIITRKNITDSVFIILLLIIFIYISQKTPENNSRYIKTVNSGLFYRDTIILLLNGLTGELPDTNKKEAFENYITLKELYLEWKNGLPGSNNYHKRKITEYLLSIAGREIVTESNYILVSPDDSSEIKLTCRFLLGRWLQIKGKISNESVQNISEVNPKTLEKWWRSKVILSVKGRIKNFKLGNRMPEGVITLYLDDIRLEQIDNIKNNSKK